MCGIVSISSLAHDLASNGSHFVDIVTDAVAEGQEGYTAGPS